MTRAQDLDAAVAEVEEALVDLKAWRKSPNKSRRALDAISMALNGANGRLARIRTARYGE